MHTHKGVCVIVCPKCKATIEFENAHFCYICGTTLTADTAQDKPPPRTQRSKSRGNGQGSVYKRGKTYTAIITVGHYIGEDGNTVWVRRTKGGFKTKKEAVNFLPELKAQVYGVDRRKDYSFHDVYNMWLDEHKMQVSKGCINSYKAAWRYYSDIYGLKINEIRTETLQNCIDKCPKGKRTKEMMRAVATQIFKFCLRKDIVNKNYSEYLKAEGEVQEPRIPFTMKDLQKMWAEIKRNPASNISVVLILCYTGLRLGELLSLQTQSFYEEDGVYWFVGGSKTAAGKNRRIPVPSNILPLLRNWGLGKKGYGEWLISVNGRKMREKDFREKFYYPALKDLGLPRLVPHCCRHTYATLLKDVNVSDKDKMAAIGHSQPSMTMHYTHADLTGIRKIAEGLNETCKQ